MKRKYSIGYVMNGQPLQFTFETEQARVETHLVKALSQLPGVYKVFLYEGKEEWTEIDSWEKFLDE